MTTTARGVDEDVSTAMSVVDLNGDDSYDNDQFVSQGLPEIVKQEKVHEDMIGLVSYVGVSKLPG